jgi:hypothetical protein
MNYILEPPTEEELIEWDKNKLINPRTKRKIKKDGPTYELLQLKFNEILRPSYSCKNNYEFFRKNKIDPITYEPISNNFFCFPYKWNPYSGERSDKLDENGPLYFNSDTLITYYYLNRLKHLWIDEVDEEDGYYEGRYGDALGNGPDFNINSRGKHYEWHLFRLPIIDCYLDKEHNEQYITMGPLLNDEELMTLSKESSLNLLLLKKIYDTAISKEPYLGFEKYLEEFLEKDDLELRRSIANKNAVEILKTIKKN